MSSEVGSEVVLWMEPELAALAMTRLVLRRLLPGMESNDAALYFGAVTEILANAVHAHRAAGIGDPVRVDLTSSPRAAVVVTDRGPGFGETTWSEPPASAGLGQGLTIARAVCPDLRIDSRPGWTAVTLPVPDQADAAEVA